PTQHSEYPHDRHLRQPSERMKVPMPHDGQKSAPDSLPDALNLPLGAGAGLRSARKWLSSGSGNCSASSLGKYISRSVVASASGSDSTRFGPMPTECAPPIPSSCEM